MKNVGHDKMNQGVFLTIGDFLSVGSQVYLGINYNDFDAKISFCWFPSLPWTCL